MEERVQHHIRCRRGDVGRYAILPGDPGRVDLIARYLQDPREVAYNREFRTVTGLLDGEPVTVTSTGIGGPSAAIAVEELTAIGTDTFIRVGTAGGISLAVEPGDVAIAAGAIRMEGTTRQYMPIEFPAVANFQVTRALVDTAVELGIRHHVGVVQSKDSYAGQHSPERMPVHYELIPKWEAWKQAGTLCSEMECAALFVTSSVLGARAGGLLMVGINTERAKAGLGDEHNSDVDLAIRIAIGAMRRLIAQDREGAGAP